jgi:hypothetical protein
VRLAERVKRLEAHTSTPDYCVWVTRELIRADGSRYEERYLANRGDLAYSQEEFNRKVQERAEALDGQVIDVANAPLLDLLAGGYYVAIVHRIDTWFTHTSAPLPVHWVELADALRPVIAEGSPTHDEDVSSAP